MGRYLDSPDLEWSVVMAALEHATDTHPILVPFGALKAFAQVPTPARSPFSVGELGGIHVAWTGTEPHIILALRKRREDAEADARLALERPPAGTTPRVAVSPAADQNATSLDERAMVSSVGRRPDGLRLVELPAGELVWAYGLASRMAIVLGVGAAGDAALMKLAVRQSDLIDQVRLVLELLRRDPQITQDRLMAVLQHPSSAVRTRADLREALKRNDNHH